jgi:hypothetical protein
MWHLWGEEIKRNPEQNQKRGEHSDRDKLSEGPASPEGSLGEVPGKGNPGLPQQDWGYAWNRSWQVSPKTQLDI